MDNAAKLLEKIKEQNVKPTARWRFTLKNGLSWSGFLLAVIFGALAFSVILFAIQQIDFNIIEHMSHSFFELMLALVPFFWIISLILFLILAIFSLKYSKKGYKLTSAKLLGFCVSLSMLAGTLFFISGGASWLEKAFSVNVALYESIQERKTKIWSMPEEGYISGTIISGEENELLLGDFNGKTWKIDFAGADIVPAVSLMPDEKIKIIGRMISTDTFKAEKIRPWGGEDRMNKNPKRK